MRVWPKDKCGRGGFTLTELIIAIGLFAVVILGVLALAISLTRSNQETSDRAVATNVARRVLERSLRELRSGSLSVSESDFWTNSYLATPFHSGTEKVGPTDYQFRLFTGTPIVEQGSGNVIGAGGTNNRLKSVSVVVNWFADPDAQRSGYGTLELRLSRLVREGETW